MLKNIIIKFKVFIIRIIGNVLFLFYYNPNYDFYSDEEIINKIIKKKKSLARYGDGEFKWILGIKQTSFQSSNAEMSKRLLKILKEGNNNLIIGIPKCLCDFSEYTTESQKYWKTFCAFYGNKVNKLIENKKYANCNLTRPYMDYKNKEKSIIQKRFNNFKKIWKDKNVVIVEGEFTRFGVGNDLLDNCNSVKRIICPSKNAYNKIKKIEKEIKKLPKSYLFLLCLGPTATIISSDLSKIDYQLIDIGHLDIEYTWFLQGNISKSKIKGKYVNEAGGMSESYENNSKEYEESIIKKIL